MFWFLFIYVQLDKLSSSWILANVSNPSLWTLSLYLAKVTSSLCSSKSSNQSAPPLNQRMKHYENIKSVQNRCSNRFHEFMQERITSSRFVLSEEIYQEDPNLFSLISKTVSMNDGLCSWISSKLFLMLYFVSKGDILVWVHCKAIWLWIKKHKTAVKACVDCWNSFKKGESEWSFYLPAAPRSRQQKTLWAAAVWVSSVCWRAAEFWLKLCCWLEHLQRTNTHEHTHINVRSSF